MDLFFYFGQILKLVTGGAPVLRDHLLTGAGAKQDHTAPGRSFNDGQGR